MPQTFATSPSTIVSAALAAWSALLAVIVSRIMASRVNQHLPESERISSVRRGKNLRKQFKQLYPRTKLVLLLDAAVVVFILSIIVLAESLFFG
jgi:hypothetical protein